MIELYLLEQAIKSERDRLDQESARRACAVSMRPPSTPSALRLRRRLALLLLSVADRLDPRPALSTAHIAGRPHLNGTLHHA